MSNLDEIGEPRVGGLAGIFLWTGVLIFRFWRGLGALHPVLSALGLRSVWRINILLLLLLLQLLLQ